MLIATFNETTGWSGKTITRDGDAFVLQDFGRISATDVMSYDAQGQLSWADEGVRAWVGGLARSTSRPSSGPTSCPPTDADAQEEATAEAASTGSATGRTRLMGDSKLRRPPKDRLLSAAPQDPVRRRIVRQQYASQATAEAQRRELKASTSSSTAQVAAFGEGAVDVRTDGQKAASIIGLLLLIVGIIVVFYFVAIFDVSVPVDYGGLENYGYAFPDRVNNIGRMSDRNNGIIVGILLAAGGGALMVVGRKRMSPPILAVVTDGAVAPDPALSTCASCGVNMAADMAFCPHCGAEREKRPRGKCNGCGEVVEVGVDFCPYCGKKLSWPGAWG